MVEWAFLRMRWNAIYVLCFAMNCHAKPIRFFFFVHIFDLSRSISHIHSSCDTMSVLPVFMCSCRCSIIHLLSSFASADLSQSYQADTFCFGNRSSLIQCHDGIAASNVNVFIKLLSVRYHSFCVFFLVGTMQSIAKMMWEREDSE